MKQTAVQWLEKELSEIGLEFTFDHPNSIVRKILDEALEMEKQQILDAMNEMQKECVEIANNVLTMVNKTPCVEYDESLTIKVYETKYKSK